MIKPTIPEPIADKRTAPAEMSFISFILILMFGSIISQISSMDVFIISNVRTRIIQINMMASSTMLTLNKTDVNIVNTANMMSITIRLLKQAKYIPSNPCWNIHLFPT